MLSSQGPGQDIEHARAVLLLIAVCLAIFWRQALRILIAIVVVAVCVGVLMLVQSVHA